MANNCLINLLENYFGEDLLRLIEVELKGKIEHNEELYTAWLSHLSECDDDFDDMADVYYRITMKLRLFSTKSFRFSNIMNLYDLRSIYDKWVIYMMFLYGYLFMNDMELSFTRGDLNGAYKLISRVSILLEWKWTAGIINSWKIGRDIGYLNMCLNMCMSRYKRRLLRSGSDDESITNNLICYCTVLAYYGGLDMGIIEVKKKFRSMGAVKLQMDDLAEDVSWHRNTGMTPGFAAVIGYIDEILYDVNFRFYYDHYSDEEIYDGSFEDIRGFMCSMPDWAKSIIDLWLTRYCYDMIKK
jgi:hypothetical protein